MSITDCKVSILIWQHKVIQRFLTQIGILNTACRGGVLTHGGNRPAANAPGDISEG